MSRPGPNVHGSSRSAANARRVEIVEFVGDPAAEARLYGLAGEVIGRAQGGGQLAYVGAESDPSQAFYGYGPGLQRFVGAATGGARNAVTYRDTSQGVFETGSADNTLNDPVRRMLAERMRRRR